MNKGTLSNRIALQDLHFFILLEYFSFFFLVKIQGNQMRIFIRVKKFKKFNKKGIVILEIL